MHRRDFIKICGRVMAALALGGCTGSDDDTKPLEYLAIYYGYPSMVNDSQSADEAASAFSRYGIVIKGDGVSDPQFDDYDTSVRIINLLQSTKVFGYVNLGCEPVPSLTEVAQHVDMWKNAGAAGIFYDCAGPDYISDPGHIYNAAQIVRDRDMLLFLNTHQPRATYHAAGLGANDYVLVEPLFLSEGNRYDYPYMNDLRWLIENTDVKVFGVATYDTDSDTSTRTKQYRSVRNQASDLGLDGVAFTNPTYSASGPEANRLSDYR